MKLSDLDYDLPEDLIAQEPPAERDAARMLVLHRAEKRWEDRQFRDLPSFLREGDCLVLNDSRVLPSRLLGNRGQEVMLLEAGFRRCQSVASAGPPGPESAHRRYRVVR